MRHCDVSTSTSMLEFERNLKVGQDEYDGIIQSALLRDESFSTTAVPGVVGCATETPPHSFGPANDREVAAKHGRTAPEEDGAPKHRAVFCGYRATQEEYHRLKSANVDDYEY